LPDYVDWSGQCVYCTSTNVPLILLLVLVAWLYVLFFYRTAQGESAASRILLMFVQVCWLPSLILSLLLPSLSAPFRSQMAVLFFGSQTIFVSWLSVRFF
jgi:hypothetical protein